mmetsp:Transcript_23521/g.50331  ORF Transcript_23521/g.50331 Transcript_23521/m.50331 type:complete len:293 (-) Transcript_23521:687-1565(-)
MGKYDRGYIIVGYLGVFECRGSKESIRQAATCCNSHGRQLDVPTNIPHSVNTFHVRFRIFVHGDVTPALLLHAHLLQPQGFHQWTPSRSHDNHIHILDRLSVVEDHRLRPTSALLSSNYSIHAPCVPVNVDPVSLHFIIQRLRDHVVEVPQRPPLSNHKRRVRPQRLQHPRQFHRDVPRSNHHGLSREGLQFKEPVRVDGVPGDGPVRPPRRHRGVPSRGEEDMFCTVGRRSLSSGIFRRAVWGRHPHNYAAIAVAATCALGQAGSAPQPIDAGIDHISVINPIQSFDVCVS